MHTHLTADTDLVGTTTAAEPPSRASCVFVVAPPEANGLPS